MVQTWVWRWWSVLLLGNSLVCALRLPEWMAPAAMPTRDAFVNSDTQSVVLPLRSAAYPVISVGVGIPRRDVAFELRWDIGIAHGLGVSFIGRMAMMTIAVTSDSMTSDGQSEVLRFGSTYALRLPIYPVDAPTPVSRNDGIECLGNDPFGNIHFTSQGWLDMSNTSPLWTHWNSYSLSSERLLLGAYRPPDGWRTYEVHVERADYFNVSLRVEHPLLASATTSPQTPSPVFRLRFDLSCDYTYIPLGVLRPLLATGHVDAGQPATTTTMTTALLLSRALTLLTSVDAAHLHACFVPRRGVPTMRRHHHQHHNSHATNTNDDAAADSAASLCFALTGTHSERQALRVNRLSDVEIVLGRRHARHFIYGRDVVRNATSALLLDALMPHIAEEDYFWLGTIAVAVVAVWYFGVYVGAFREHLADELFAQLGDSDTALAQQYRRQYGDQRSLFYFSNQRLMIALVNHTRLALFLALGIAVFGFRLDNAIYLDLPRIYVRALVFILSALCVVQLSHTTTSAVNSRPAAQTVRLAVAMGNAALLVVWLVFSVRAHRFINALVMVGASYMLTLRTGQTLLEQLALWCEAWSTRRWRRRRLPAPTTAHLRHRVVAPTRALPQIVDTLEAFVSWLVVAWLFNGFSVPFLVDIWMSTAPFKLELLLVSTLFVTVFTPIYLYSRAVVSQVSEANHLVAHVLGARIKTLKPLFRQVSALPNTTPLSPPALVLSSVSSASSLLSPSITVGTTTTTTTTTSTANRSSTRGTIVQRHTVVAPATRRDLMLV